MVVKIALLSCGIEYCGVQKEIEKAVKIVGAVSFTPKIDVEDQKKAENYIPFAFASKGLKIMQAMATVIVEGRSNADCVLILTCHRCAEGSIARSLIRRFLQQRTKLPVVSDTFTERSKAGNILLKIESLVDMVEKKPLFARNEQKGITMGIDSGSTMTKGVIMKDNEVIVQEWSATTEVKVTEKEIVDKLLLTAGMPLEKIEAIGVTGYGRKMLRDLYPQYVKLAMEEVTVCAKGAVYLSKKFDGDATIVDIGGMDNKAITVHNGLPDSFSVGGICAGASGRFLEIVASRLGVSVYELGNLALSGNPENIMMNSYCVVFGMSDLNTSLAQGATKEDVAAAACNSVAEQFYEQQMQDIDIREPVIQVGGTSLIKGLNKALREAIGIDVQVPPLPHLAGAVGAALLVSGMQN